MKNRKKLFLLVSIVLVVVLTATTLLVNTFSWYNRELVAHPGNYNQLNYEMSGKINYDTGDATVKTYLGTVNNGNVVYGTEELSADESVEVKAGELTYFKTVITNNDTSGDSVVSLYLTNLAWSDGLGNNINIGIMGPEKTYKNFTSTNRNMGRTCIEDNIVLVKGTGEQPSQVEVEWFIRSDDGKSGTVTLGAQYPVYN